MSILKAPYNFVPLSDKVICPEWGEHVSHDIPFEDAKSGVIEAELITHSPIFVRDGQPKEAKEHSGQFFQYEDKYYIPGSSVKGMVRNVLEIISFGKIKDRVNNHRYAIRDLRLKEEYLNHFQSGAIYSGWLIKNITGGYELYDCNLPGRISHEELSKKCPGFYEEFMKTPKEDYEKSAKRKYDLWKNCSLPLKSRFDQNRDQTYAFSSNPNSNEGVLVFTGQQGPNNTSSGKYLEFIFFAADPTPLNVSKDIINDFFFAYYAHDINRQSTDFAYWLAKLNQGQAIPVFFLKEKKKVKAVGLSYLFKLPYLNSVVEAMPYGREPEDRPDFSDLIFGYVKNEEANGKEEGLKGRVHFGHAYVNHSSCKCLPLRKEVLSSPKASYYPNYIKQNIEKSQVKRYKTFMDKDAQIAGWKRYPVHKNGVTRNINPDNPEVSVSFIPIDTGAHFKFSIHYHNLKQIELGALLSALTFHAHPNAFHSLGMAKPLGYGKIRIKVNLTDYYKECLKEFESYMRARISNWTGCDQIKELLTMACDQQNTGSSELAYMEIKIDEKRNDFVKAKQDRLALDYYSKLDNVISHSLTPLASLEDEARAKEDIPSLVLKYKILSLEERKEKIQEIFKLALRKRKELWLSNIQRRVNEIKSIEQHQAEEERLRLAEKQIKREEEVKMDRLKDLNEKHQIAVSNGPDLSTIAFNQKSFDHLKTAIRNFVEIYYFDGEKKADYKKCVENMQNKGVIHERFHSQLIDFLVQIVKKSNKNDRLKWEKAYDNNPDLKKVAEWIGEEKARKLTFNNP